ncbi:hypothetical protein BTN50_0503 [Candidatus Enterovibrio altilux]|uniref:Uncharacterized protein n=1 Tax=Candidatus Enterovibrio altilux TaxID=1927128 RepID=A0A291B7Q5_9GAMM|nr:hypothetical protein BTN50_0503 [Candidatus Enterovibrio luxaltus]
MVVQTATLPLPRQILSLRTTASLCTTQFFKLLSILMSCLKVKGMV